MGGTFIQNEIHNPGYFVAVLNTGLQNGLEM
jgi:hypothetical protein